METVAQRSDLVAVLVGATRNAKGEITYGGMRRASSRFILGFERSPEMTAAKPILTLQGNIVSVSAAVVGTVGVLDPSFYYVYGDIDYRLGANRTGIAAPLHYAPPHRKLFYPAVCLRT